MYNKKYRFNLSSGNEEGKLGDRVSEGRPSFAFCPWLLIVLKESIQEKAK